MDTLNRQKKLKKGMAICLIFFAVVLILSGIVVFYYPIYSDSQYKKEVKKLENEFQNRLDTNENLPYEKLYEELKFKNKLLFEEKQKNLVDPFSYEQPGIDLSTFGLQENIIGFLTIPKMEIELPILLGANEANMKQGAVHLTETSYPIGGTSTNCVIAAHRGYSKTAMFRDIEKLNVGDEVTIRNFRERLTYKVVELRVIEPDAIDELLIQAEKDMVTLVTCHPYGFNYQRYVVFCERVRQ